MPDIDVLEWPSGIRPGSNIADYAGRIEYQRNTNGDAVYTGYAPKADSPTSSYGWIIEYRTYDGSNKLLKTFRKRGTWNERTSLFTGVGYVSPLPVVQALRVSGVARAMQWKRGTLAVNTIRVNAISAITTTKKKIATFTVSQVKLIGVATARNITFVTVSVRQVQVAALAQGVRVKPQVVGVRQIRISALATGGTV